VLAAVARWLGWRAGTRAVIERQSQQIRALRVANAVANAAVAAARHNAQVLQQERDIALGWAGRKMHSELESYLDHPSRPQDQADGS
jgi:hypothetical protein